MYKKNFTLGVILIIIGILSILNKVFHISLFSISNLWPLFILIPGLLFEFGYFTTGRDPGLLVPGGILTTIGLLFLFETFTNWNFAEYTWPVYPLSVAIGLFQLYIFGKRPKVLLIPVFILSSISIISFAAMFLKGIFSWIDSSLIFPVILITIGVVVLFNGFNNKKLF
jgi:hypothetical protein